MVEKEEEGLSIVQQCILLSIYRSGIYYQPVSENELDLKIMLAIDKYYTKHPYYGTRRMSDYLKEIEYNVGKKAVRSYYIKMGIWAIYPKKIPNTSESNKGHKIYPYLLRNLEIKYNNQVWATDITYIPMPKDPMYANEPVCEEATGTYTQTKDMAGNVVGVSCEEPALNCWWTNEYYQGKWQPILNHCPKPAVSAEKGK